MAKIQFKAILHKLGLWLVVKDGPHKCPPSGGGGLIENHNESNNYFRGFPSRFSQLFSKYVGWPALPGSWLRPIGSA